MTKTETSLGVWSRLKSEHLRTALRGEMRQKSKKNETALERFQRLYGANTGATVFPEQIDAIRRIRTSMRRDRDWLSPRSREAR